jgi:hypothetical protein
MRIKKAAILLAVMIGIPAIVWGGGSPEPGTRDSSPREAARANIGWNNDSRGFLFVQNDVDEDLILFAGSINNRNALGGVRKLSTRQIDFFNHVSDNSGTFLLRAVKESAYRARGSGINTNDVIFAGLVVYNKNEPRIININIQRFLGGDAQIILQNDTNMAVQIRLDRPDGPTVTTLAPLERNKIVYLDVNPHGYVFFPVYQYYDRASMGIRSVMAQTVAEGISMMPMAPRPGVNIPVVNFTASPAGLFSPFATVIVTNETNRGVYFLQGSSRLTNQNGTTMINPGSETYELNLMGQRDLVVGGLSIDPVLGQSEIVRLQDFRFEAEYTYQVRFNQGRAPSVERLARSDRSNLSLTLINE